MGIETVSLIIATFVSGATAVAALMRNYQSRLCLSFFLVAVLLFIHDALGVLVRFQTPSTFTEIKFQTVSLLMIGPAMVIFLGQVIPSLRAPLRRYLWSYAVVALGLSLIILLLSSSMWQRGFYWFAQVCLVIPAVIWIKGISWGQKKAVLSRERTRLKFAFWGGIVAFAFFTTDLLHFAGAPIPPLGNLARVLYLLLVYQTFVQKELLTPEEMVGKLVLFGGVSIILSLIYSLLVSWVGDRTDLFFFNTFIASFVIILLFDPIRKLTSRFSSKLFLRKNAQLERELIRLETDLMGVVQPLEFSKKLKSTLEKGLGITEATLFVLDREELSYVALKAHDDKVPSEIPATHPLVEYMNVRGARPFVYETISGDSDALSSSSAKKFLKACQKSMHSMGVDFLIPFTHDSKLMGFCVCSTQERTPLSNEQLRLWSSLCRNVASCLKNAQTLKQMTEREKLAVVGEMAAGLAHEIKNPLGAIKGAAQLLEEDARSPKNEFLNIIQDETDRLSAVLSDFLDYAKPRRDYEQPLCNPIQVIEHTVALLSPQRSQAVEVTGGSKQFMAEVDPEILKQVLLNLFINAMDAMENSSEQEVAPKLQVAIRTRSRSSSQWLSEPFLLAKLLKAKDQRGNSGKKPILEIEIKDNGPGISEKSMDKIFMPFYTTKPKGTGLGLAICQRLIESMNGTIQVRSNHPRGAVFLLHLPMREVLSGPFAGIGRVLREEVSW